MSKKTWKDFEQLIGWINTCLEPTCDVVVDEKIKDIDTNSSRQVDITVRPKDDPSALFFGEVRDHEDKVNATYVEHVYGKTRSLGAQRAFIVSRSGFYEPAVVKARAWGIDTFTYEEGCENDWGDWCTMREITQPVRHRGDGVLYLLSSKGKIINPHPSLLSILKSEQMIITDQNGQPLMSFQALYEKCFKSIGGLVYEGLVADGPPEKRRFDLDVPSSDHLWIRDQNSKPRRIRKMVLVVPLWITERKYPLQRMEYKDNEGAALGEVFAAEVEHNGRSHKLELMGVENADGSPAKRVSIRWTELSESAEES